VTPPLAEPMVALQQALVQWARGRPDRYQLPMPQAREELEAQRRAFLGPLPAPAFQSETLAAIASPDGKQPAVTVHTYVPGNAQAGRHAIFLHGGGWCVGSSTTHWPLIHALAQALQAAVHSVDYPLAPEHPYPAAPLAVQRATAHVLARHRPAHWWLAGDSAGANLALVESLRRGTHEPQPDGLWLAYGCYREPPAQPDPGGSWERFGQGPYGLTAQAMWQYRRLYAPGHPGAGPASLDPLYAVQAPLPPAWLLAASHDPLLDDTLALAGRLQALGSPHRLRVLHGHCHGCLAFPHWLPEVRAAWDDAAGFLSVG
jgi:acetyl esterase